LISWKIPFINGRFFGVPPAIRKPLNIFKDLQPMETCLAKDWAEILAEKMLSRLG
jgi:hypothetical protein